MQGSSTRAIVAAICACAAALATTACGGGTKTAPGTALARTPTAVSVTKIPEVDRLIDLATSANVIGMAGLTGYEKLACSTTAAGPGDPPACREAEADGDVVEVLASTACEGGWVRPEKASDAYRAALGKGTPQLFAVYIPKEDPSAFGADFGVQYVIVMSTGQRSDGKTSGVALHVRDGRIVWLQTECEFFLALVSQDVLASFVVGPIVGTPNPAASPAVTVVPEQ